MVVRWSMFALLVMWTTHHLWLPPRMSTTRRCAQFSISDAREASGAFEASGITAAWSAALSLPALGPPTMEPTPALELLTKRNVLRTRNRGLSDLTAESSPPPPPKRRAQAPSLPVASPHTIRFVMGSGRV